MRFPFRLQLHPLRRSAIAIAAVLVCATALRAQAVLQEWTFDSAGAGTLSTFGWAGWSALNDEPAVNHTRTLSFDSTQPRLGRIKNIKSADGTMLLAASSGSGDVAKNRFVAIVNFPALSLAEDRLGPISWSQACTSGDGAVRLLVCSDGKWFASTRLFTTEAASGIASVTNPQRQTLDLAGPEGIASTSWHTITFADQTPIDCSAEPTRFPLGRTITGIGFLIEFAGTHDRRIYIDNVILATSIP